VAVAGYASGYTGGYTTSASGSSSVTTTRAASWAVNVVGPNTSVTTVRATSWRATAPVTTVRATSWAALVPVAPTARATSWLTAAWVTVVTVTSWDTGRLGSSNQSAGVRLRVYGPVGADLGQLPSPTTIQAAVPFCDVPTMNFDYHPDGPKAALLGKPCEVAVEVTPDDGVSWFEPPNCRFVYTQDGLDELNPADMISVTCLGYVSRFKKARVLPAYVTGQNGSKALDRPDGKRAFLSATPGLIMKTLINEAQARFSLDGQPALKGIGHQTWTATTDSNGRPWSQVLTIYYDPGLDYLTILLDLVDQGFLEFEMRGRDLYVYNFETLATDWTNGPRMVTLRAGRDLREADRKRSWDALADYVLVAGDEANFYETRNAAAITPWGRQEVARSDGRVSDPGTMAILGQSELVGRSGVRAEYTRTLDFVRAKSLPFFQYDNGDWVWSTVTGALPERLRVRQITITRENNGAMSGSVILNDRFLEAEVRAARRINGITNGASGNAPAPDKPPATGDKIAPGAPTNLLVSSLPFLTEGGFVSAQATLTWVAPPFNTNGTPCVDLDYYEVFQRPYGTPVTEMRQVFVTSETTTSALPAFPAGSNWTFAVRAVDKSGNRSFLSGEINHGMAQDNTPPQAASTPVVANRLGTLSVQWDGAPATGVWPGDFSNIEVHASTTSQFTPDATTYEGDMFGAGTWVITDRPYGIPVYVRLVSVDKAGLKGDPSAQGSATPARVVGSDIDPDAITFAQFAYKDIGSYIPDGTFESDAYRAVLDARSSGPWYFTQSTAFHGTWSATIDASTGAGTVRRLELEPVAHPVQAGEKRFVRMAYRGSAGANGTLRLNVEWFDASGALLSTSWVEGVTKTDTWQEVAGQLLAPNLTATFKVHVAVDAAGTTGTYWVDAVEVRDTVSRSFIEDLAVSRALIDNLAVNDAKIADLAVGKLTAGTISADMILAGRFRTATSGNRVEFDSTGIRMYSGSTLTGNWLTSAGQLRIYNSEDASHTSTGHGIQFGITNGQNMIIDDNEILSRFNGDYGSLFINREGGPVLIGGRKGGFPTDADTGVFPADADHQVTFRAGVAIYNVSDAEYADEFPPLLIGRPGSYHLWFDSNEIGATSVGGDGVGTLYLQGRRNSSLSSQYHNESVVLSSDSLGVRRFGSYDDGVYSTLLYGWDSQNNVGIRLSGNSDAVFITSRAANGYKPIKASSFDVNSSKAGKKNVTALSGALDRVKKARSQKWKYANHIEEADRWHVGPMLEDLPAEVVVRAPEGATGHDADDGVSVPSLVGLLWEAVRELSAQVDALEGAR
jgi:hypothetical protein